MGSFLPLDELEPTLSDVLAFIDTFDSDATTSSSSASDDGASSPPPSAVDCRKTRKAAASRRCQQKKRAELLALRAQVTTLTTQLKALKNPEAKNRSSREVGDKLDKTQKAQLVQLWRTKAQLERQLRRQSEDRNKALKTALARQSKVAQAVQDVLTKVTAVVHIEEALRTPSPTMPSVLEGFVPNLNDAIYGELSARLGQLYLDVTTSEIPIQTLSAGVEVRRDAVTGLPFVELTSAIMTNLDLKQTGKSVFEAKACSYSNYRKYVTELGTKKETELELRNEEVAVELSTLSLSRSYEEANRLILTFSSLVCNHPTNAGMRFREEGFVLLTGSATGTMMQSRYRLTPDIGVGQQSDATTQSVDPLKLFVLERLGSRMWSTFQHIRANCTEAHPSPAFIPAF